MSRDSQGNPSQPHCILIKFFVCNCRQSTCLCVVYVGEVWAYLPLAPLGCKSSHRSLVKIFFFFFFFFHSVSG